MTRTCRKQSAETKRKISESLRGKTKKEEHKKAISEALKRYWATIPTEVENKRINDYE